MCMYDMQVMTCKLVIYIYKNYMQVPTTTYKLYI